MKHVIILLFFLAMGFTCVAKNNNRIDYKVVDKVRKELDEKVLTQMKDSAAWLENEVYKAQASYDKLKDRRYDASTQTGNPNDSNDVSGLKAFPSIDEMFYVEEDDDELDNGYHVKKRSYKEKLKAHKTIEKLEVSGVRTAPNVRLAYNVKTAYQTIIDMKLSLNTLYDKATNDQYIKDADEIRGYVIDQHKPSFDKLVSQINDYEYYMYELARMFVVYDETEQKLTAADLKNAKKVDDYIQKLLTQEKALFLLDVPYTRNILYEYILLNGEISDGLKNDLKEACADAFTDL